jgi:hypothetical protein
MVLWDTIYKKLKSNINNRNELIDIRYLAKWVIMYPSCFPKYVQLNNHNIIFNSNKLRYEFHIKRNDKRS